MANYDVRLKDGDNYLYPKTKVKNITDLTASKDELNKLHGLTASTEELNKLDGVTSNVQTQLNAKQPTVTIRKV